VPLQPFQLLRGVHAAQGIEYHFKVLRCWNNYVITVRLKPLSQRASIGNRQVNRFLIGHQEQKLIGVVPHSLRHQAGIRRSTVLVNGAGEDVGEHIGSHPG